MRFIVALFVCTVAGVSVPASAETCPGNPDALGTSRVLTINPGEFTLLGTIQYKQTLPLNDHEVVLTFDDGPLPPYTNIILDTLASQCVKATYFLVGQMAHAYPSIVRRIYNEGHTIGTHSQDHPRAFERLSMQRVEREVDGGINSVTAALGDAKALSPFFRIPGFGRTNAIDTVPGGQTACHLERRCRHQRLVARQHPGRDRETRHAAAGCERPRHHFDARHPSGHGDGATDPSQGAEGERLSRGTRNRCGRAAKIST